MADRPRSADLGVCGGGAPFGGVGRLILWGLGTATGVSVVGAEAHGQRIRFDEPVVYVNNNGAVELVSADFDGDSHADLATLGRRAVFISFNGGAGELIHGISINIELAAWSLLQADMDTDGDVDLVWIERLEDFSRVIRVWFNDGDGRSGADVVLPLTTIISDLAISDITADGIPDIVFFREGHQAYGLIHDGVGGFEERPLFTYPNDNYDVQALISGDFDDDGDDDLAVTFQYFYFSRYLEVKGTQVVLLRNDGDGVLHLQSESPLPWQRESIVVERMTMGDLDGDGDLDVAVFGSPYDDGPNALGLLEYQDDGGLLAMTNHRASFGQATGMAMVDMNGDGRLDLVTQVHDLTGVSVFRNEGDFELAGSSPFHSGLAGRGVGAGDVTGDGRWDLLVGGAVGFSMMENTTAHTGPWLHHSRLIPGERATIAVSGAEPGERVYFAVSLDGVGNSPGFRTLGGITLDLRGSIMQLGSDVANAQGRARVVFLVPPDTPPGPVGLQAVVRGRGQSERSTKSRFQTALIED